MQWMEGFMNKKDLTKLPWRNKLRQLHRRCKDFIQDLKAQGSTIQAIQNKVLEERKITLLLKVLTIRQQ